MFCFIIALLKYTTGKLKALNYYIVTIAYFNLKYAISTPCKCYITVYIVLIDEFWCIIIIPVLNVYFAAVSSHTILPNSSTLPNPAAPANNAAMIAAVLVVLAVAGIAIVAVILIIVVVIRKNKRKAHLCETKPSSSDIQMTAVNNNLDNPMYSGMYI